MRLTAGALMGFLVVFAGGGRLRDALAMAAVWAAAAALSWSRLFQ